MLVCILNKRGEPLMPCHPAKARELLKQGKVKTVQRTPYTIRLLYGSSGYKQSITLGVDSGFINIGLSAATETKEIYSAEVKLRTDIVKLNSERKMYRRNRRNRKTWYRQARFLNRKKPEGWLAPSIQHKLDSHIKIIEKIHNILPISKTIIEVAAFDIQKIKNPDVSGIDYQNGEQTGFWNTREYVLHRDGHTCQHCKGKSKDKILEVHHIESRQTGGDSPGNLITLCSTCHDKVSKGKLVLKVRPSKQFRAETFMSMVRWKLVRILNSKFSILNCPVSPTYGYITKSNRIELGLPKSHTNDAFVIAGGNVQTRTADMHCIQQVRKCNRKLFKGDRSHIKNTAPREVFGFRRYDKVKWNSQECFIFGRRSTGYFDLRTLDGTKVHSSAKYNALTLIERAGTLLTERRKALLPAAELRGIRA
jgi:hypothetical protein